ncbi:MAG: hypothetical protein ACK514_13015 [Bacteroidota bacterium]|jgi:hypothetical protein|nr:hypothetical protein [Cytophagales bacterium]MCE2957673.1 hypothetical protein [Flammeovirgaceae bacterium]MCZ8070444.1 hypothetical protein [Cytophagales bacterium]
MPLVIFVPLLLVLQLLTVNSRAQAQYFNGAITYQYKSYSADGKQELFPINLEETYFFENKILNKVTSGLLKSRRNVSILIDTEKMIRYQIDYDQEVINDLGGEKYPETINLISFNKLTNQVIRGERCNVYNLSYLHSYDSASIDGSKNKTDTLKCEYFISTKLRLKSPEKLAFITGNRSSKFIDGRFDGIPLKVVINNSSGFRIVIEAVKIDSTNVSKAVELPNFPIISN